MGEFTDKIVVVTGGSRGIGREVALNMANEGSKVIITYQGNENAANETVEEIKKCGTKGFAFKCDSGDFTATKKLISTIKAEIGKIDMLVNNSGIGINKSFYLLSEKDWDEVIQTNLKGTYNFCRNVVVDFLKRKSGVIVNISSVAGFRGLAGQANYCASKAGIIGLTQSMAAEFGRAGIRINTVAPGYIKTDMTHSMNDSMSDKFIEMIPARKFGEPEDVAEVIKFLLSSKSKYILGSTIVVDGGLSI